jgi:hypothetical protein
MWAFLFKMAKTYYEKLKDPRWQKKRLEVMERDGWECTRCGVKDQTFNVHHWKYAKSGNPWDSDIDDLDTLCEGCHKKVEDSFALLKTIIRESNFIDWYEEVGETNYQYWHLFMTMFNVNSAEFKAAKIVFEEKWRVYYVASKNK